MTSPVKTGTPRLGLWIITACVLFFLFTPVLIALPLSFNPDPFFSYPIRGISLRWYENFLFMETWTRALRNSVIVGLGTVVVSVPIGILAAIGLSRAGGKFRAFGTAVILAPMIVPVVITALGTYFFFSKIGLTNSLLGLIIGHSVLAIPFVVLIMSATLSGYDHSLTRASASLGARPFRTFLKVTAPVLMPGIASSAIFAFVTSFDEVVMVVFLAGVDQHTLTREMWKGIREDINPTILAVAMFMVLVSVGGLSLLEALRRKLERDRNSPM